MIIVFSWARSIIVVEARRIVSNSRDFLGLSWPETIEECDAKTVKALEHIIKKWKMDYIPLPIKLVHSDIISTDDAPMTYESPNTVIADDSSEFVQFLYKDRKNLRTSHEVLAIMLAFVPYSPPYLLV
jgi:hypothetical protein